MIVSKWFIILYKNLCL